MKLIKCATLLAVTVALVQPAVTQPHQVNEDRRPSELLERQVAGTDLELLTTVQAFTRTLGYSGIQGGVVGIGACEQDSLKHIWRPMGSKVRDVLDSIVLADPRYRWEYREGVVNLLPVSGVPALLSVRIGELQVADATDPDAALDRLRRLPEVKKAMANLNLNWAMDLFVKMVETRPKKRDVRIKDATVLETLNTIAREFPHAIWYYSEFHCDGRDEVLMKF